MKKETMKKLSVLGLSLAALDVSASDWSSVTGGIDLSGESTAVMAVVGVLATVYVVKKGAGFVLGMLK